MAEVNKPTKRSVKVGVIQMEPLPGNVEVNVEKALSMVDVASLLGARYICLHELLPTDYITNIRELAEPVPGPTTNKFQEIAAKKDIFLVVGLAEREESTFYNTAVLIGPGGEVAKYRKTHLWNEHRYKMRIDENEKDKTMYQILNEINIFKPGKSLEVSNFGEIRAGVMICYDGLFPEIPRILALKGADVIFYLNNRPALGEEHIREMARQNTIAIAAANRIGKKTAHRGEDCFGESMMVDQWGVTLGKAWNQETVIVATIDVANIRKGRKNNPSSFGRRPLLYSALAQESC